MQRLPFPDPENRSLEVRAKLGERLPLNIYRMLCHAPTFFPSWMDLGGAILYGAALDPQLRELAILRVGYMSGSVYETHQHYKIGLAVGLTPEKIEGLRHAPEDSLYTPRELLVLRMTEHVLRDVKAPDALFRECVETIGDQQTMELLISIGFYRKVVRVIENTGIDIEAGGGPSQDDVVRARERSLAAHPAGGKQS